MSIDEDKNVEDMSQHDAELQIDEAVDQEQVIDEVELEEAKAKTESEDEDETDSEDSDSDEEEEDEDEEEMFEMPKTKAAIMASVNDMMKKAGKEEAKNLYASLMQGKGKKVQESSEEVVEGADVSHIDYQEDLDIMVAEEATLSEGFRQKAGVIFEAALKSKISEEVDRLEAEYAQNLEEEVTDIKSELVEKVDSYLNYVVETWMKDNELAVVTGLRTEVAEDFMVSLQSVFKEHYIEVPEGKVDMVDDLASQVAELEESLNKSTEDNIRLFESVQGLQRVDVVRRQSSELAATEAEKLASLVEDLDFDDAATFEMKVKTIKESYFKSAVIDQIDESQSIVGLDSVQESTSDAMAKYTKAISNYK
tara:strand:+ start:6386 stop:7483 length:1098 start_codon:yes stop_codon:yes gene_type:complete